MDHHIDFTPTPTEYEFMTDDNFVRVLLGPIGSGKSVTCVIELMRRILQQQPDKAGIRASRWVILRNTVDQLRSTSLRTLLDWLSLIHI